MDRVTLVLVAAALVAGPGFAAAAAPSPPRLQDPRLTEASGLAPGLRSPGVLWIQNDSGDTNRVFAVDARSGATAAVATVRGATNVDWEDLAVARDAGGVPSLWIADTGDNGGTRRVVQLYRVPEPHVRPAERGRAVTTPAAAVWRLRYPGGQRPDVEALAVFPGGRAYLVTKSLLGGSLVYRVPKRPDASRVRTLTRVGEIRLDPTGTPGGPNPVGQLTVTGAAVPRDGGLLAVRTYTDAYFWPVRHGDVAAALRSRPTRVALPTEPQGEGVAIAGGRLLLDTEGVHTAIRSVPLPTVPRLPARPVPATGTASATAPSAPPPGSGASTTPSTSAESGHGSARLPVVGYLVGGVLVAAGGAAGLLLARRRARRRP